MQDKLRKMVKLAKVNNDDLFYKDFASYLDMTEHSFYNWLKGYYNLGFENTKKLEDILIDLIS